MDPSTHLNGRTVRTLGSHVPRPRRETVVWGLVLVNVQLLFLLSYSSVTGRSLFDPFLYYPLVWIDVGLWALLRTKPPDASARTRRLAAGLAVAYVLLLAFVANVIGPGEVLGGNPAIGFSTRLFNVPPGWAPALLYNGPYLHLSLRPPYVVGFLALGYLVYATILEARGVASLGLLGVLSCLSCTLPVLAAGLALATGVSTGSLVAASAPYLLPASTALYVLTVALLYWRPGLAGTAGSTP